MYTLYVVDDQVWTTRYFKNIDWQSYDIQLIGTGSNGKQAMEDISRMEPDMVITDIKMPVMDGLELCKKLSEDYPAIQRAILSAYDEFELARSAMSFGVKHYLLKPIDREALFDVIDKLKKDIDKEQGNTRLTKESIFLEILTGDDPHVELGIHKLKELKIPLEEDGLTCLVFCPEDKNRDIDEIKRSIQLKFKEIRPCQIIRDLEGNLICITNSEREFGRLITEVNDLISEIKDQFTMEIKAGISSEGSDFHQLSLLYEEAKTALTDRFYMNDQQVYAYQDHAKREHLIFVSDHETDAIYNSLKLNKFDQIYEVIKSLEIKIIKSKIEINDAKYEMYTVVKTILQYIEDIGKKQEEIFDENMDFHDLVYSATSMNALYNNTISLVKKVEDYLQNTKSSVDQKLIDRVIDYIEGHYSEKIALKDLADEMYVSMYHLSRVFKKVTGDNLTDYISKLRIEKSKELLKNPKYKVYEIAYEVGFTNEKYFAKIFKKLEGLTPSEFKKKFGL